MIPERIMRKIERCLALSQSANSHEAGAALRQAQALMTSYGVSQDDIALSDFDAVEVDSHGGKTPPRYVMWLSNLISGAFGTSTVYISYRDISDRPRGRYEFIGPRDAVKIAAYSFEVLLRQLLRDRKAFQATLNKRLKRKTKVRRGDAFAEAWVQAAAKSVTRMTMSEDVQALHLKYQERRHGELTTFEARKPQKLQKHDLRAARAGYETGRKVRLSAGVTATRRDELTQLHQEHETAQDTAAEGTFQ